MKKYRVARIDRFDTYQILTVEPVTSKDLVDFEPGQYATVGFYQNGRPTPMRPFSITSAPGTGQLQFAMRPFGKFTSRLRRLRPGDRINIQGPFGNFIIDHSQDERLIMLAAGIGITPILSIIRDATRRGLSLPITLIYSNSSAEEIPFKEELLALMHENPLLNVVFSVTDSASNQSQRIIGGRVNAHLIEQLSGPDINKNTFFVCGPSGYLRSVNKMLKSLYVDKSAIITESFSQKLKLGIGLSGFGVQAKTITTAVAAMAVIVGVVGTIDLWQNSPQASAAKAIEQLLQDDDDQASKTATSASNNSSQSGSSSSSSSNSTNDTNTYYSDPYGYSNQSPSANSFSSSGTSQTYVSPSTGVS